MHPDNVVAPPSALFGRRQRKLLVYDGVVVALLIALCVVTVAALVVPNITAVSPSIPVAVAFSTTVSLIALAGAYFAFGEFLLYGRVSSLYVGVGFLVFTVGECGMGLVPLLIGFTHRASNVSYGWGLERVLGGILFLMAASVVTQ
jgi:hypothetical protein